MTIVKFPGFMAGTFENSNTYFPLICIASFIMIFPDVFAYHIINFPKAMKYQLVFSRHRNERNNYESGNPSENMLLFLRKEASGPRRGSLDLWRPLKTHTETQENRYMFLSSILDSPYLGKNKFHISMYLYLSLYILMSPWEVIYICYML